MTLHLLFALFAACAITAQPEEIPYAAPISASQPSSAIAPTATDAELDEFVNLITGNNEPDARQFGAARLLRVGTEPAADRLVTILKNSTNPAAQLAVCQAIAAQPAPLPRLVEPILALLGENRPGLNEAVAAALRRFDPAMTIKRLRPLAADEEVPLLRRLASISALGAMGDEIQAVAALVALLRDERGDIQAAALGAISRAAGIHHESPKAACDWWELRRDLSPTQWLQEVNARRADQVVQLQQQNSRLTSRLISLCRESYLATPQADRPKRLLDLLKDDLRDLRLLALGLINAIITDRQEVGQDIKTRLLEMTVDPDDETRIAVAKLVGDLRLPTGVVKLSIALAAERGPHVRAAQVNAIGRFDDLATIPMLTDRLNDDAPSVVGEAAAALGAMARRGNGREAIEDQILPLLVDRFARIAPADAPLREQFLVAMAQIPSEKLRSLYETELRPDRPLLVRRAALVALGGFADADAAAVIRPLASAPEPELRLAAVAALGRAGRNQTDLRTLESRLDGTSETDAAVRERAWQSFLSISQRLTPPDQISIAARFEKDESKIAQRRRLDLLKALRLDAARFDSLLTKEKTGVLAALGDSQERLGENKDAVDSFRQALDLSLEEPDDSTNAQLLQRLTNALLESHEDAEAIERINAALRTNASAATPNLPAALARIVASQLEDRIQRANDADDFADVLSLLSAAQALFDRAGGQTAQQAIALQQDALEKQLQQVDRLLGAILSDPSAEGELLAHGAAIVLPRLHKALTSMQPTSAPATELDGRLVEVARKLAPAWSGYPISATSEDRRAALARLHEIAEQLRTASRTQPS